ncbi:alpha-ribazole phosphatase [Bacteroidales bacterium OttesenSCG-928-A17]|nr:alpha-ribazole phosphatase [Bacteroidales bacterium OttesenSCG-928-A17]
MKITMVRHTSVDVPSGVCYGFSDVALNSSFEAEAEIVKSNLAGRTFDKVYSSPLSRCTKLAEFCGFPVYTTDDRIKELNFGNWELKSWMEIDRSEAAVWFGDWLNYPTKDGESYAMMQKRVNAFLNELKASGLDSVCIFTHGGVIRLAHVYFGLHPIEESFEFAVEYGQVFDF